MRFYRRPHVACVRDLQSSTVVSFGPCLFVLAPDLGWVSSLTDGHATCFAVRFHRGGKLFISHGGSLWAGKLAVLLRLHHSRHSRQLASCVKDLPLCGMNKIGCSMNKIGWFINRSTGQGIPGVFLNKIGLFVESTFWAPLLALF